MTRQGDRRGEGDAHRAQHPRRSLLALERGSRDHDGDASSHRCAMQRVVVQALRTFSGGCGSGGDGRRSVIWCDIVQTATAVALSSVGCAYCFEVSVRGIGRHTYDDLLNRVASAVEQLATGFSSGTRET